MNKRPLHVCLISEEYPPETGWGGIGTYTYNLARGLAQAGHRVEVVAGCLERARTFVEDGVRLHRIGFAPPRFPPKRAIFRCFQLLTKDSRYLRKKVEFAHAAAGLIRNIHRHDPFDVCETSEYDSNGFFVARAGAIPMVIKIHTSLLLNYKLNALPLTSEVRWCDYLERYQTLRARALTSPSRKMVEIARPWLRTDKPIQVVPNPIDTREFSPEGPRSDLGRYFFYTGRLERRKGVHILLAAFRQIQQEFPDLKLVLAGHDTPTYQLAGKEVFFKEYAAANGLLDSLVESLVFLGKVDRRDLPPLYRGSLACVFPSESFENFPYSCLEAMACGKGAIVTDAGGMAEMVEDGRSGHCVAAGSIEALVGAMRTFAADPGLAARLGEGARQRVMAEYTMARITQRTLEVYLEAMQPR